MALYKGKKTPYEAFSKRKKGLDATRLDLPIKQDKPTPNNASSGRAAFSWPTRPRPLQYSAGRLEMSLTVPTAVVSALAVLVLVLLAFQLGKGFEKEPIPISSTSGNSGVQGGSETILSTIDRQTVPPADPVETVARGNRDNWIVIQQYQVRQDLEPVKEHFDRHGIQTTIRGRTTRQGLWYFLVTDDLFEGTSPGTDGHRMIQQIKQVGASYKAPPNFETFAPRLFADAYGEKRR